MRSNVSRSFFLLSLNTFSFSRGCWTGLNSVDGVMGKINYILATAANCLWNLKKYEHLIKDCWNSPLNTRLSLYLWRKLFKDSKHCTVTKTFAKCTTAKTTYKFSPLTHLIQLLHVSDDLSGVLHLQHCCSHHHSLLLVLELSQMKQTVNNTIIWQMYLRRTPTLRVNHMFQNYRYLF